MTEPSTKTENWIRDRETGQPIPPMKHPGYYPGYSTLSQRAFWDAKTREVVENRVYNVPPIRFFNDEELQIMTAVANRIIPQDDRLPEYRIPIVNYIDDRLHKHEIDGFRFEDMPPDEEAYRIGLKAIDRTAQEIHGMAFADLDPLKQDFILKSIKDGKKLAAQDLWDKMSIKRFWHLIVQDCAGEYYAHPWAWDEIGYGGPAYPRAYTRLEGGLPEPWEVDEKPYYWSAPINSISDIYEPGEDAGSTMGQGGTH